MRKEITFAIIKEHSVLRIGILVAISKKEMIVFYHTNHTLC